MCVVMGAPRFEPRSFTTEPEGFGRIVNLRWIEPETGLPQIHADAARLQHQFSILVRRRVKAANGSLKQYAADTGTDYWRLCRVLRGEVVVQIEDMMLAARFLRIAIRFEAA